MLKLMTCRDTLLRIVSSLLVTLVIGSALAPTVGAVPPNGDTKQSVAVRRGGDQTECTLEGGSVTTTDDKDSAGDLVASTVECKGSNSGNWSCTESLTQSVCGPLRTSTPPPTGPRAPVNAGVNGGQTTAGQPTPPATGESTIGTLEQRTRAEMTDCSRKLGSSVRIDYKSGDQLVATVVQCAGGGRNGTVCVNAGSASRCQTTDRQPPAKPVLNGPAGFSEPTQAAPRPARVIPVATPTGMLQSGG